MCQILSRMPEFMAAKLFVVELAGQKTLKLSVVVDYALICTTDMISGQRLLRIQPSQLSRRQSRSCQRRRRRRT